MKLHEKINNKSILAIDFGEKKLGLAIFISPEDLSPYPYKTIKRLKNDDLVIEEIKKIVKELDINIIVLGIPLLLDGKSTTRTKRIESFGKKIQNKIKNIDFFTQDETLSTYAAKKRMEESPIFNFKIDTSKIDEVAACIILEDFLQQFAEKES